MKANRKIWIKLRMTKANDGRRKLSDDERENIRRLHKENIPIREIARMYEKKCSRRLVQLVIFPERAEVIAKRAVEVKRWEPYNTKELRKPVMRKYRAKLKAIYGIIERYK